MGAKKMETTETVTVRRRRPLRVSFHEPVVPPRDETKWYPDELSQALLAWRESRGWTQKELAVRLGVRLRTYQNWEKAWRRPGGQAAVDLCAILDEQFPKRATEAVSSKPSAVKKSGATSKRKRK